MERFDPVGSADGGVKHLSGLDIHLDFPVVGRLDLEDAPARLHIDALNFSPALDTRFGLGFRCLQEGLPRKLGDPARRLL